jgi:predicted  nucleic acid-binding Zn-ribbon protein
MPHQCLKCGKVFPSGSMEIFRGCSNCKGKRFFYTEAPISEDERKQLTERANKDIKELVRDLLTQREGAPFTPGKPEDTSKGWVKVDKDKKITALDEKTATDAEVPSVSEPSKRSIARELGSMGEPGEIKTKLQQILDEEGISDIGEREKLEQKAKTPKEKLAEKIPSRKEKAGKKAKAGRKKRPSGKKPKKEIKSKLVKKSGKVDKPEVITILEPGVYEIDLEQLMDHSPIIIMKDGTYLLHLPSLFQQYEKK